MTVQQPDFIETIIDEVSSDYWQPESLSEWIEVQTTKSILHSWEYQQEQERNLRKLVAVWIFILISIQILYIINILTLDGFGVVALKENIIKILLPTAFAEIFGMGFIVVKYLFKHPEKSILETYLNRGH